jgi:ParB family chromosome partitioning protein
MTVKRNALGRGLSALLENADTDVTSKSDNTGSPALAGAVANIPISKIEANPFQPRTDFEQQALSELADSIRQQGIIQPVTVRKLGYDRFQLISGERRLRASQIAGLDAVPAYIRIANDQAMLEMALVENIQRENLNAIEVAISYKRLMDECSVTQEELCTRVGKNRTTVTNYIRLLKLPPDIQAAIRDGKLSMGHARAIISMDDPAQQLALYKEIITREMSVRDVEQAAKIAGNKATKRKPKADPNQLGFEFTKIQNVLSSHFATKVYLRRNINGSGKIIIPFENDSDLNRLLELLNY